ncbi:MAG: antibiotic biosynthesis monooxygenase, partial [SAR324 cluster bacterium]|nr:antibiotic biosynthesis monooxygenase [SAR324 cluster bacterium]
MINVIAAIEIKEGRVSDFIKIFKANIPSVLKEKGCLGYTPT